MKPSFIGTNVSPDVLRRLKERAAERGITLRAFCSDALTNACLEDSHRPVGRPTERPAPPLAGAPVDDAQNAVTSPLAPPDALNSDAHQRAWTLLQETLDSFDRTLRESSADKRARLDAFQNDLSQRIEAMSEGFANELKAAHDDFKVDLDDRLDLMKEAAAERVNVMRISPGGSKPAEAAPAGPPAPAAQQMPGDSFYFQCAECGGALDMKKDTCPRCSALIDWEAGLQDQLNRFRARQEESD